MKYDTVFEYLNEYAYEHEELKSIECRIRVAEALLDAGREFDLEDELPSELMEVMEEAIDNWKSEEGMDEYYEVDEFDESCGFRSWE